jgi:hypothetical protein
MSSASKKGSMFSAMSVHACPSFDPGPVDLPPLNWPDPCKTKSVPPWQTSISFAIVNDVHAEPGNTFHEPLTAQRGIIHRDIFKQNQTALGERRHLAA